MTSDKLCVFLVQGAADGDMWCVRPDYITRRYVPGVKLEHKVMHGPIPVLTGEEWEVSLFSDGTATLRPRLIQHIKH